MSQLFASGGQSIGASVLELYWSEVLELYWSEILELYFGRTDSFLQGSFPFYLNYKRYIIENLEKEILNKPQPH